MNNDFKNQLLNLTIQELFDLIKNKAEISNPLPIYSDVTTLRYTLGKLDATTREVIKTVEWGKERKPMNVVAEYEIVLSSGTLCFIKEKNDIELLLKELNLVIAKFQK
jgi:hypothetical protein